MEKTFQNEETFVNTNLCSECGGKCCKIAGGCSYTTDDFKDLSFNNLYNILLEGKVSITAQMKIDVLPNGKKCITPFLTLRVRNIDRPIVDLLSTKTPCTQLGETGCNYDYENRPTGGKNLVPAPNCECQPLIDIDVLLKDWENYQKVLSRLVKRFSGMSVDQRLRLDVEDYLIKFLCSDDQSIDNISVRDIEDMVLLAPHLMDVFPEETIRANKVYEKQRNNVLKNKLNN